MMWTKHLGHAKPQVIHFTQEEQSMMKKGRAALVILAAGVCLAGCRAKEAATAAETEPKETEASIETEPEEAVKTDWQQAYVEYLASASDRDDAEKYVLIYVDDNDIPELVQIGNSEAEGCQIVSFAAGKLQKTQLSRLNFTYLEREGLLCNSDGNMDCYWDLVYRVQDGLVTQAGSGYYGIWQYYDEDREIERDEEGIPVYLYEWNGEKVTEEAYSEALYSLYDLERCQPGYRADEWYSAEELTEILNNWQG